MVISPINTIVLVQRGHKCVFRIKELERVKMTLYVENKVNICEKASVSVNIKWHQYEPLLAVANFSQEKGGFILIFDETGEPLKNINYPTHRNYQVTALSWHPERLILCSGWENGDIKVWNGTVNEFLNINNGLHATPITLLSFSEKGSRLVSCDSTGSIIGWKVDNKNEINIIYHLELKEQITQLTFRLMTSRGDVYTRDVEVAGLAKAAVNGDEYALDMFSNWRPKTIGRKVLALDAAAVDSAAFFIGTQNGLVYYVTPSGSCMEVLNVENLAITSLIHHPTKNTLIIMMEGLTIGYFSIDNESGHLTEIMKVKLNAGRIQTRSMGNQNIIYVGNSNLALLTGDLIVRIWNLDNNENHILPTTMKMYVTDEKISSASVSEIFTCLAYCEFNQTLAGGTNIGYYSNYHYNKTSLQRISYLGCPLLRGRIYFWTKKEYHNNNYAMVENAESMWELSNINNLSGTIKQLEWGSALTRLPLLSVNCVTSVYLLKEQNVCSSFSNKIWAIQKTATQIHLESSSVVETDNCNKLLQMDSQVNDVAISEDFIVFLLNSGREMSVYDISWNAQLKHDEKKMEAFSVTHKLTFSCDFASEQILIYKHLIIAINSQNIVFYSTNNGSVLSQTESKLKEDYDGAGDRPIGMDVTQNFLTVFTFNGFVQVYDLLFMDEKRQQLKLHIPIKNVCDMIEDFGEIIQAKVNADGSKLAIISATSNLIPDGKLYIWDIEKEILIYYDFRKQHSNPSIEYSMEQELKRDEEIDLNEICNDRIPLSIFWCADDPRLFICNAKKMKSNETMNLSYTYKNKSKSEELRRDNSKLILKNHDQIIVTMFVLMENRIQIHDVKSIESDAKLLAFSLPYVITIEKLSIVRNIMHDFIGLEEDCDQYMKQAIINFYFNLNMGNTDAAFKSIRVIKNQQTVWTSLVRMCVKTKRLDVACVCLGQMGDAKATRALKRAINDSSLPLEAKMAVLAIELGLLDEAEQFYIKCERFDLLNKLLQCRNKMMEAQNLAQSKDRIHLKNTCHAWAKTLERDGNLKEAMIKYEKAETHRTDVPRMLYNEHPQQLYNYMMKAKDKKMLKWWAQYVESQGDMNAALKIYANSNDIYSQVRILCFLGDENKAIDLMKTNSNNIDKIAFYHMAKYYESFGNIQEAINYYMKAGAYANAIRTAKEHDLHQELWSLGEITVSHTEKLQLAKYFEEQNMLEKAAILYYRCGMIHKALNLTFKIGHYTILHEIVSQITIDSDPAVIDKCIQYFIDNEQFNKAVDLLATSKQYKKAIELCLKQNVRITEDLAEKLSPEKNEIDDELRINILQTLGECLMLQGDYHLATKKFTQAGDKIQAMKALLKSGDTEKILSFASITREREIYIMAANYLQSLDWQSRPEVLRNIITFYSKAKAMDLLANFYVACAQVEIDECKNYRKALDALDEAAKCLEKIFHQDPIRNPLQIQQAKQIIEKRRNAVQQFVNIQNLFERGDFQAGMTQCSQFLLLENDQHFKMSTIRRGDIYNLMIHHCVKFGKFIEGKQLLFELKESLCKETAEEKNMPLTYYINKSDIEAIAKALNIPVMEFIPIAENNNESYNDNNDIVELETI